MKTKARVKRSQAFSLDIMLAVVIFIGAIFVFFTLLSNSQGSKVQNLEQEAANIIDEIVAEDSDLAVVSQNKVNITKLEELIGKNYSDIKKQLRIENDFCIYFEDDDGNIIYINSTFTGIGSETINVSNVPCS